jgi:cytochrome b561
MKLRNSPAAYGAAALAFHWMSALLVITSWLLGTLRDNIPKGGLRASADFVHISAGQLIVLLLIARLVWRAIDPPPAMVEVALSRWANGAAKLMHFLIYALLAAIPVVGVISLFAAGKPLPLFGLAEIASPWVKDRSFTHSMEEIHELLANILLALVLVHASAALFHHYYFKDATLSRMLPSLGATKTPG